MMNLINSPKHKDTENRLRNIAEELKKKYKYNPDRDWWLRQVIRANKSKDHVDWQSFLFEMHKMPLKIVN